MNTSKVFAVGSDLFQYKNRGLRIMSPSCSDDGTYTPPQEIFIYGLENIIALRNELSAIIKTEEEKKNAQR